jgi:hypothetical protein
MNSAEPLSAPALGTWEDDMVNHGIASKFIGQARKESQVARRPLVSKFLGRKEQTSLELMQTQEALMTPSSMDMPVDMPVNMPLDPPMGAPNEQTLPIELSMAMEMTAPAIAPTEQIATYEPFLGTTTPLETVEQTTTQPNLIALLTEVYEEPKKSEPSLEDLLNIGNNFHQ